MRGKRGGGGGRLIKSQKKKKRGNVAHESRRVTQTDGSGTRIRSDPGRRHVPSPKGNKTRKKNHESRIDKCRN